MKWIVDASVAIRWIFQAEADERAEGVLDRLVHDPLSFAVPELFAFEVFAVLCRTHTDPQRAYHEGIVPLLNGGMYRQPMTERLAATACEYVAAGLSGYDACYASLANELRATWLTYDRRAHDRIASARISHCLLDGMPPGW